MSGASQVYKALQDQGLKRCTRCRSIKPIASFSPRNAKVGDTLPRAACKPCNSNDAITRRDPTHNRRKTLSRYGLSLQKYQEFLELQSSRCAICDILEKDAPRKRFAVDHDHKNGLVRGLLCFNCNTALGKFKDDSSLLLKAYNYLKRKDLSGKCAL